MTESQPEKQEDGEQEPSPGSMAGIEKTFLRLTFWQTILSVAGVFTGAVALYAALTESQAVRQQTAATVWPYVQLMVNDTNVEGDAYFSLSLDNVGVGPARMRSMQLSYRGEPVRDWQSLTAALMGRDAELGTEYGKNSVSRRVLAPGESIVAIEVHDAALALKMQEAAYSGSLELIYCYCSIFDECWRAASNAEAGELSPQSVEQCADYGEHGFLD